MLQIISDYIEAVLKQNDCYELFNTAYEQQDDETREQFIRRCATLDFDDGVWQGALYQEIYDELTSTTPVGQLK